MFRIIICLLMFLAVACAPDSELEVFYGDIEAKIISGVPSDNGAAISGVIISVMGQPGIASVTTAADGSFSLVGVQAGEVMLKIEADGFITQYIPVKVLANGVVSGISIPLLTAAYAAGKINIILTWGEKPEILDSHLYIPLSASDIHHICYAYTPENGLQGSTTEELLDSPFARLDQDHVSGFGPETTSIKLTSGKPYFAGTYRFWVDNFSYTGDIMANDPDYPATDFSDSSTQVRIFKDGVFIKSYNVPTVKTNSQYWHVFDIDPFGNIVDVNYFTNARPVSIPYIVEKVNYCPPAHGI